MAISLADVQQRLERLNVSTLSYVDQLAAYSTEQLNAKPSSNTWSVAQNLFHLMLSEQLSLAYCAKKLSYEPKLASASFLSRPKEALINLYLKLPVKFDAPKAVATPAFPAEGELQQIRIQWQAQRDKLATFFNELPSEQIDQLVYKHPYGGRITFLGMLDFFEAHIQRHQRQIKRTLKDIRA